MGYEWASLLGDVDIYSARRSATLVDNDEKRRRGRVGVPAVTGDRAAKWYLPTGIAAKPATISIPSGEQTIASILQPPRSSQQDIIALFGALASRRRPEEDDELRRGGGGGGSAARQANPFIATRRSMKDRVASDVASRAALSAGAQPVVIKVTSTVSSRASAAGLLTYLGTRDAENENGKKEKVDIPVVEVEGEHCRDDVTERPARDAVGDPALDVCVVDKLFCGHGDRTSSSMCGSRLTLYVDPRGSLRWRVPSRVRHLHPTCCVPCHITGW